MSPEARHRSAVRSQCAGKHRYRDWEEAKRVRSMRAAQVDHGLRIYECNYCLGFHLTKQELRG